MNAKKIIYFVAFTFIFCGCATKQKNEESQVVVSNDDISPLELMRSGKAEDVQKAFSYKYNIDATDDDGNTVLHLAAAQDNGLLCQDLLLKGADPELKNNDSDTPFHIAVKNDCEKAVKVFANLTPECLFLRDANGKTVLDIGVYKNEEYYDIFVTTRVGEIRDTEGQTIVHYFAKTKNYKGVRECVNKGIPVNVKDNYGQTPLSYALQDLNDDNNIRIVAELVSMEGGDLPSDYSYFQDAILSRNYSIRLQDGQTPLHVASICGHTGIVKYLLANGADVNVQDSSGATPLHEALRYGNLEITKMLFDAGANPNITDNIGKSAAMLVFDKSKAMEIYGLLAANKADFTRKDMFGDTALHTACMCGTTSDVVQFLVDNGADVNAKNKEGATPLGIAVQNKDCQIIKILTAAGADINAMNAEGVSPVIEALTSSQEVIEALVNEDNAMTVDSQGNTPLHIALLYDAPLTRVKYLVSVTKDVNIRNREGNIPLFICVMKNRKVVGEMLLQKGGDIFCANTNNNSPLRLALKYSSEVSSVQDWLLNSETLNSTDGSGNTVLHYAAEWQYADAVDYLLSRNVDANKKNANGQTSLFNAAKSNNPVIIQKIIDGGANLYVRDNLGSTPLHMAVRYDAEKSVLKLIELGIDVDALNTAGKSALAEAALSSKMEIAQILLENGANPNTSDINGVTILMDAIRGCNESVVKMLLKHGASPNTQDINGRNAYHEAAFMGNKGIIRTIRMAGGNPLVRDKLGKTPFSIVQNSGDDVIMEILGNDKNITDSDGNTPLHIAVMNDANASVLQLLINAGYTIDSRNSFGYTALNLAIEQNDVESSVMLLSRGADPFQMIDKKGRNGVTIALEKNNMIMIENIVKYAGSKSDGQGNTILHYAAKVSPSDTIASLCRSGLLDLRKTNVSGDTPLVVAQRWKRPDDVISFLQ